MHDQIPETASGRFSIAQALRSQPGMGTVNAVVAASEVSAATGHVCGCVLMDRYGDEDEAGLVSIYSDPMHVILYTSNAGPGRSSRSS